MIILKFAHTVCAFKHFHKYIASGLIFCLEFDFVEYLNQKFSANHVLSSILVLLGSAVQMAD